MFYYEVWPRSSRYHGTEALTYSWSSALPIGQIVTIPMQHLNVPGVVVARVSKPISFAAKPLTAALDLPALPAPVLQLARWLQQYYPAPLGMITQQLLPEISKPDTDLAPLTFTKPHTADLPPLTAPQINVLAAINKPDTYLLHGVTGSGKTRVYVELAARALAAGRSSLILTPEISLTSQLAERFRAVFGQRVLVMHSQQTAMERRRVWQQILLAAEPVIVIGPRSILFSPLRSIGLIVLDEAHEPAYKQEQAPHYQAARVASYLRELHDAEQILGSASPLITDYFLADQRGKQILTMDALAAGKRQAQVHIIDLKDRSQFPRSRWLSQPLIKAMSEALSQGQQTLLYLNRRGTARLVICESCGWQAECPTCDLPLTYHGDTHNLRCHVCNITQPAPSICPDCNQPSVIYKSIGTKAIVTEVQKLFPQARLARFDTDNKREEQFSQQYNTVKDGRVDILIGTQMLAKGLDLPRLSVVGVLVADTSLQLPDYTAAERTYQLLLQVLGRIGRGHVAGQAFVQTYQPNNPAIADAATANWPDFYKRELSDRKVFKYPPYVYLLKLSIRRASSSSAAKAAATFATTLRGVEVVGPAPALREKVAGKYVQQLVIKSAQRSKLLDVIKQLPAGWSYDIDPADLL
ncbi:MAG TPA: primosomal protein N' [Candidatus Saccharibacteria bacterium]|nr:primosomal protein N' [Candidatus Saccharibacteria bacterium]